MIPQVDPVGRIYTAPGGVPLYWNAGVGYDAAGRMCTTTVLGPNDQYVGGWRLDPVGRVVVAASLDAQIAALFAAGEQGAWYDPSDMSSMFQDVAGTIPVNAIGQRVARINDKSGRNNHATQATTGSQPFLRTDGNGNRYLEFDGVDDVLGTAAINFTATGAMTLFVGLLKSSDAAGGIVNELSVSSGANLGTVALFAPTGALANFGVRSTGTVASFAQSAGVFPAGNPYVLTGQMTIATDLLTMRVNGVNAPLSGGTDQGAGNYGNFPMFIGARSGGLNPFNGRLYGLILRGAASDAAQIASGEAWCNSKAGAF